MNIPSPPPLPAAPRPVKQSRRGILLVLLLVIGSLPILLRLLGLLCPYKVPTAGMSPAMAGWPSFTSIGTN